MQNQPTYSSGSILTDEQEIKSGSMWIRTETDEEMDILFSKTYCEKEAEYAREQKQNSANVVHYTLMSFLGEIK
jgi:hypothetical protein